MVLLYLFGFDGWVKLGVARCPCERLRRGFWQNVHPKALCGKLDDAKLLRIWAGDYAIEQALHAALLSDCGEFYRAERTKEITEFIDNVLEILPLPPTQKVQCCKPVKRACCLGRALDGKSREDHMFRALATKGKTAPCPKCGKVISIRNDKLKAHQKSKSCTRQDYSSERLP
jgi:hypothetical protein